MMAGKIADLVVRVVVLALAWLVVSEGRTYFLGYGAVCVAAAVVVSLWARPLRPPARPPLLAWLSLAVWAAGKAVAGAIDVARRALGPSRLVDPVEEDVEVRVPMDRGGLVAVAISNLMPGSLVHRIGDHSVGLHALSPEIRAAQGWRELQKRLARAVPPRRDPPGR